MDIEKLFDQDEYKRWLSQAQNTLSSAIHDLNSRDFNWCCFKCQQAAEYSVKALLRGLGQPATGHSVLKLLESLEKIDFSVPEDLKTFARSLDKHYIPARYPDVYPEGAPFEFYDEPTAKEAIRHSEEIINFVRSKCMKY